MPDEAPHADIVYICSPNNPTGATYSVEQLKAWVAWAKTNDAVILFDAAYECFVSEQGLARSIYEVEGAKEVAIEVCSFSKIAGFTGTRAAATRSCPALADGKLNKMWLRRQTTVQRRCLRRPAWCRGRLYRGRHEADPAEPRLLPRQRRRHCGCAGRTGIWYCGGKNSPYIWLRCPNNMGSWEFFDWLLENAHVGHPGEGFGPAARAISV